MIALDENSRLALCDSSLPSFKDGETLWLWRHGVIIQPQQVSKHLLPAETALDTKVYNLVVCQLISWPKRNAENVLFLPTWSKDNYGTVGRRASHGWGIDWRENLYLNTLNAVLEHSQCWVSFLPISSDHNERSWLNLISSHERITTLPFFSSLATIVSKYVLKWRYMSQQLREGCTYTRIKEGTVSEKRGSRRTWLKHTHTYL